ncbi:hypothetical protein AEQU_2162 [Adlercreutzia equolifaciens DSM 19450]|nr:hypothetical protein AEQU_2162 [Adlercreutzia equolifaciens DSM 19450]
MNHDNHAGKRRGDGWKDDFIAHLIDGDPSARGEVACRLQLCARREGMPTTTCPRQI